MFNAFISCVSKAAHDVGKDQEIVTANNCTLVHASPLPMYSCTKQLNTSQNVPRPRMRTAQSGGVGELHTHAYKELWILFAISRRDRDGYLTFLHLNRPDSG